jgi:transcriptional regulator with XRE-family HTH domain
MENTSVSERRTMELAKEIGKRLEKARINNTKLTQEEVAAKLGIGRQAYNNIVNGRNLVTVEHLVKLETILGESVVYFLGLGAENNDELELIAAYRAIPDLMTKRYILEFTKQASNITRPVVE